MRNSHLMRVKVGIILNFLLLGCMVIFLTLFPLLISGITGYLDSGESIFFPQLMSKINFLPLTLGQFLDHCIILSLLWFVLSSFFPLVRKIRERLKLFPSQMYLPEGYESAGSPRSWILSDISRWDTFGTGSPIRQGLNLDLKNEWTFAPRTLACHKEKILQFNQTRSGRHVRLILSSWALLVKRNNSISVLPFVHSHRFPWMLFNYSDLNFELSHKCLWFSVNSSLVFRNYQNFVKIWTPAISLQNAKSELGGEGG